METNKKTPLKANTGDAILLREQHLVNRLNKKLKLAKKNTQWEELTCVGYHPQYSMLVAVVSIKEDSGYNGDLCGPGCTEYIRFFIDWGDGAGFENVGLTSFQAHDIHEIPRKPQHPLHYMVYLYPDVMKKRKCCNVEYLPKVRAVLSRNVIPSLDPNVLPEFGNRLDANIQIEHLPLTIRCLLNKIPNEKDILNKWKQLLDTVDIDATIPHAKNKTVAWSTLIDKYKKAKVPDHRLVYEGVKSLMAGVEAQIFASLQPDLANLDKLKIDISKVSDIIKKISGDTTYEELVCVGLNTATDTLGAIIHVKKPCGYSGNLCQAGSREYVAFWADWNNDGIFESYLGHALVAVHDISTIPEGGLFYSVSLPADDIAKHLKSCKVPNIIRIRAVLSWALPPSTTNPDDLMTWGNRRDALVQIRPGAPIGNELVSMIYDVGGVPIDNIHHTTYLACPSAGLLPTQCHEGPWDRPFGGGVRVHGRIYNSGTPGSVRFRVEYAEHGTTDWKPIANSITFQLQHPATSTHPEYIDTVTFTSDNGWVPYMEDCTVNPHIYERTANLGLWNTGILEGTFDIRIAFTTDMTHDPNPTTIDYSDKVTIILDNTTFTVSPTPNPTLDMSYRLDLVITGGDCHAYHIGEKIKGHLRVLDTHFWRWVLELQPTTHAHGTHANPPCRSYIHILDEGDSDATWEIDTSGLDTCGYTLTLWAYDRAILHSNGVIMHQEKKAVGFSVIP